MRDYSNKTYKQIMIGKVHKDLEVLLSKYPEAKDELLNLSKNISEIISVYMLNNPANKENIFKKLFHL